MKRIAILKFSLLCAVLVALAGNASANELVFQGQNAALFPNANPADTQALMNSVPKPSPSTPSTSLSPASLVEQAVESQISTQIFNDIFTGSAPSGSFNLGAGTSISYARSNGMVTITITDPVNGTTVITVPDV